MTRYAMTVELHINDQNCGDPLSFKIDGKDTRTLKFSSDQEYAIKVVTKPATTVIAANIHNKEILLTRGQKSGEFVGVWKTDGVEKNKRGSRGAMPICLQMEPEGRMRAEFPCKVYRKNDSHATWGHKANYIEFKCCGEGDGSLKVLDENIR